MFTGIIQTVGRLRSRTRVRGGTVVTVEGSFTDLALGESVAVDGVCLTVTSKTPGGFTADASAETLAKTTLGSLAVGARVNLERALALGERLGGHIVAGHVDGVGTVSARERVDTAEKVTVDLPVELLKFVAVKGSVAVDGVSLTVNGVGPKSFEVMLVPYTQGQTALGDRPVGGRVNIEVDVLARYVARAMEHNGGGDTGVTLALLTRQGYIAR